VERSSSSLTRDSGILGAARPWLNEALSSSAVGAAEKKKPSNTPEMAPQVQQLLELYGGECKEVATRLKNAKKEMQAIVVQLRNYQYQKQQKAGLKEDDFLAHEHVDASRMLHEQNHCFRCAQSIVALLLRLLTQLRDAPLLLAENTETSGDLLGELLKRNIRVGADAARKAARAVIKSICVISKKGRERVHTDLLNKIWFVLDHGRGLDVCQCLGGELRLLEDLCLLDALSPEKAIGSPSLNEKECWQQSLKALLSVLRRASVGAATTDLGVAEHLVLPCMEVLGQCMMGPYPAFDEEKGLLEVLASEVYSAACSMWKVSGEKKVQNPLWMTFGQRQAAAIARQMIGRTAGTSSAHEDNAQATEARNLLEVTGTQLTANGDGSPHATFHRGLWLLCLLLNPLSRPVRHEACLLLNQLGKHWQPGSPFSKRTAAARHHWALDLGVYVMSCAFQKGYEDEFGQVSVLVQHWCKSDGARKFLGDNGIIEFTSAAMALEAKVLCSQEHTLMFSGTVVGQLDGAGLRLEHITRLLSTMLLLSPRLQSDFKNRFF